MKFPRMHKKPSYSHKRMLLTDPNSLIGYRIGGGNIKLMSVLGVGGHGVVYLAHDASESDAAPRTYAVKALSKVGLDSRQLHALQNEFALHERVSGHAHIVTFHGIIDEPDFFFVLLDYIPDGDVFEMIESGGAYAGNDERIKAVFVQLIDAVAHCHRLGVAHRDIKPENILCRDGGAQVLLADFGLATDRKVVREYGFGSEPYMAPQCFGGFWKKLGPFSAPHTDIWSLGVVLVNLACTRNPWHKATEESSIFRTFLNDPNHLLRILPISYELNAILRGTFAVNPHARPSLASLRASVLAVRCFTRDVGLPAAVPRTVTLTPGAPHTEVARQITNLTTEDIARLESEARAEARAAALRSEAETARASSLASADTEFDEDEAESPLFLSPGVSPTPTLVAAETTPRPRHITSFVPEPVVVLSDAESDSDESEAESEGPITPETRAAPDVDIASVPEISLDGGEEMLSHDGMPDKGKNREDRIPEATRCAVRRMWCL